MEGIAFSFRETRKNFSLRGVDKLANLRRLALFGADINNFVGISLPQSLQATPGGTNISSLEGISLPQSLQSLDLSHTQKISSLEELSRSSLSNLGPALHKHQQLGGHLSAPVPQSLDLSGTNISSLEGASLCPSPSNLLDLSNTNISSLEDISLPPVPQSLWTCNTSISSLEASLCPSLSPIGPASHKHQQLGGHLSAPVPPIFGPEWHKHQQRRASPCPSPSNPWT